MASVPDTSLRDQLLDRRQKLETVIAGSQEHAQLTQLLGEVDSALKRIDSGTYGVCESCHDSIEKESLAIDPLLRFCLEHLTPAEQDAFQQDLDLASQIQRELLPTQNLKHGGWEVHYHYEPAGPVSGDYCDLVRHDADGDGLSFAVGDVSGKGVAASMLMAHLRGIFRMLANSRLPLNQQIERANRVFCQSTMSTHFATVVWGKAANSGEVELSNAGHCPPLLVRGDCVTSIEATGLPLGIFAGAKYTTRVLQLAQGETLLLFTDGLSEAANKFDMEYGIERLSRFLAENKAPSPQAMVRACLNDMAAFTAGGLKRDDISVMAIGRVA